MITFVEAMRAKPDPDFVSTNHLAAAVRGIVCGVAAAVGCHSLHAGVIQVSLGDIASPTLNGPAGGTSTVWNAWSPVPSPLLDGDGQPATVSYTAAGGGPFGDWWCDLELLTGGVFGQAGETLPLLIDGLDPAQTYDLYLACSWGDKGGHTAVATTNPTVTPSPQFADNRTARNGTTWARGENFVLFQNVEPDPSGRVSLTFAGFATYGIVNGFQLVATSQTAMTFDSWAALPTRGLTAGVNDGPLDDPDLDGIVNLLEFALGGEPLVSSPTILPTLSPSGASWTFEYDRNDSSRPPGTTQVVEYSQDLVTWIPVVVPLISDANVTITDGGDFDHVQVTVPGQGSGMYARLRVTR
jgi:hypothetical protein